MELEITKYLKTLLPHFEKDQILEDLRITEAELQDTVLPSYNAAAAFFSKDKFVSKENQGIDSDIRSILKSTTAGRGATFLSEFSFRLTKLHQNVGVCIRLVNKEIGRDVVTEGVSSRKIVLMRIAERMSYVSRYSLDILNLVYINEAVKLGTDTGDIGMSKAEMTKAKGAIANVTALVNAYGIDTREFEKQIESAPDLLLSKMDNAAIDGNYSDKELDPVSPGFLAGFAGSPIYHLRILFAEWQARRYKAAQEKKKVLELRVMHLGLMKDKEGTNPRLEKEISYNQERIAKLDRYLTEVEHDLDIAA